MFIMFTPGELGHVTSPPVSQKEIIIILYLTGFLQDYMSLYT